MSLISKVKLPGQNTPYDIGVQWDNVKNKPTLATVATSGNYNDLSNIPDDKIQIFTATATENNLLGYTIYTLNCTLTEFNNAFNSKMVYVKYPNAQAEIEIRQAQTSEEFTLGNFSGYQYELTPITEVDIDGGITVKGQTMIFLSTNQVLFPFSSSKQIVWSNNTNLVNNVTGELSNIIPLANGGTGLSDDNASDWYTSNTLHPHFIVFLNPLNATFTCQYQGPLPSAVSSVSDALATDEVQYALKQPVPVIIPMLNNRLIGNGLIDNYVDFMSSNTSMRILFTDWVYFNRTFVNGINGTLTYTSTDGLFLDNVAINRPKAIDSTTGAPDIIVQASVGDLQVGSASVPVYWTGSGFAEVTIPTIPTNVSSFNNDANYINQTQLNNAISNINSFNVQVVASLPTTNIDTHTIYFISNSGSGQNIYDEYMYLNNKWEKIGTTDIDLSGYLTSSDFTNVSAYTSGGQVTQADFTTTSITPATFANVTASKASAGTAVSVYKGGGAVSQTSFTSGAAFTIAEGTVTANSAYQDGGTVSQTAFTTQSITPYTFTDVTASKATTQTAVTVHTGGGTISQTPFGTTTTSHVNS